ncbi:hypothetical protein ACFYY9_18535 [Streptomyces nigra]|uniref:hypothetical protein n=1 Tax=Streptomyces nigra TaxID=1827580 RepID=UPI003694D351
MGLGGTTSFFSSRSWRRLRQWGALFEFVTGVLNIQLDYIFPGSFYTLHFYGAWVFIAAFVVHAVLKMPTALAP